MRAQAVAPPGGSLSETRILETLQAGLGDHYRGAKVLVLIPDHTRSTPLPFLFRSLVQVLADCSRLDFMVALGTHPPLSASRLNALVGISAQERQSTYAHIGLDNHAWADPQALTRIGTLPQEQIQALAGDSWHASLAGDVPVRINTRIFDYDHLVILGPTFPHEVAGFSGGAKYLFPGLSGPEMIDSSHWLGALIGVVDTIGVRDTPVRAMIEAAAGMVPTPISLVALVVVEQAGLAGIFIGERREAWHAAVDLSAQRHITWVEKPFQRVLSCAAPMYDELWTAGKAMYKLEPVLAAGAELIIYSPHLDRVSAAHGRYIREIGYHVLDYFLAQWPRFRHVPLAVIAHSSHVRGGGSYENGTEQANASVVLSSRISAQDCRQLALGYRDPAGIDPQAWSARESEGVLVVPKSGEMLYRVKK